MVLRVKEVSVSQYQPWCMYRPVILCVPPVSAHRMVVNVSKGTVNLKHLSPGQAVVGI
jgi:hypothetical protein